jgi:hypothetical protein
MEPTVVNPSRVSKKFKNFLLFIISPISVYGKGWAPSAPLQRSLSFYFLLNRVAEGMG